MEGISTLSDSYRAEWEQPALKLTHNTTRGYHLQLPINATVRCRLMLPVGRRGCRFLVLGLAANAAAPPRLRCSQIPAAAVQPVAMKTVVAFSTEELVSLNERLKVGAHQQGQHRVWQRRRQRLPHSAHTS